MKNFVPLREEAEKRGKAIKTASDRHASPQEACKLIGNYSQAEIKMIRYVEANASKCGIPAQISDQLKNGHKNTEALLKKVCNVAEQAGGAAARAGRADAERCAGFVRLAAGSDPEQEGRQHLRYAERQRSHPMMGQP